MDLQETNPIQIHIILVSTPFNAAESGDFF